MFELQRHGGAEGKQKFHNPVGYRATFILLLMIFYGGAGVARGETVFAEKEWDFGKIGSMEKKEHIFKFQNNGKKKEVITSIASSCGCTAAISGKTELAPKEHGEMKVVYDPSGKTGKHSATVTVTTGDGVSQTITVSADIETLKEKELDISLPSPSISVTPTSINLGKLKIGDTVFYKVIVGNKGEGDLLITNQLVPNENGVYLGSKPIKKGKRIEMTFVYRAVEKGKINESVSIASNDPKRPDISIRLTGEVK
jgi:hypothetical protein